MNNENIYIARKASNINADIARNWSSWNFGEDGIFCSEAELEAAKLDAIQNDSAIYISGFELYGKQIESADIRELYAGYWVLVDNENGQGDGIFGTILNACELQDAISESENACFFGEGYRFDANEYTLVFSKNDIHIFKQNN